MKRRYLVAGACLLALAAGIVLSPPVRHAAADVTYNTLNYMAQGGSDWEVGGTLNIQSAGALKFNGTDKTTLLAAAVANPAAGVASGYRVAQGQQALGGSNPTAIATGLTTITACVLTIQETSAPGLNTTTLTYGTSTATLNVYEWKPTSSGNPTLIASTGTENFGWVCWGT